jgi:hypothetical protein
MPIDSRLPHTALHSTGAGDQGRRRVSAIVAGQRRVAAVLPI